MPPKACALCLNAKAILKRPKTGQQICKDCFFYVFETEVHNTITQANLFSRGDRVAIGASGGKGAPSHTFIAPCVDRSLLRLNCAGICFEDIEWAIRLWTTPIPSFHRWRDNWIPRRLSRGSNGFSSYLLDRDLIWPVDRKTKPTAIRHASQNLIIRRTIRMDDGPNSISNWQEE